MCQLTCLIKLALDFGFLHLELETDTLAVVNAIFDGEESLAVVWRLLDGIKALMRQFSLVRSYIPRECNKVVHRLSA